MTELKTNELIKGGAFLIEDIEADRVFTPEDFTDEQKMIAKTTEDYVKNEVLPVVENLENHEFEHSVKLLKSAGDLGLLGADVPEEYGGLGLDKISSALIGEKMSVRVDFQLHTVRMSASVHCQLSYSEMKNKRKSIYRTQLQVIRFLLTH